MGIDPLLKTLGSNNRPDLVTYFGIGPSKTASVSSFKDVSGEPKDSDEVSLTVVLCPISTDVLLSPSAPSLDDDLRSRDCFCLLFCERELPSRRPVSPSAGGGGGGIEGGGPYSEYTSGAAEGRFASL